MLVQFSVGNFRSFKDIVTLDLVATKDKLLSDENTFESPGRFRLLKSVGIYGANDSGKSNLLKAIDFMRTFVIESARDSQTGYPIDIDPFLLNRETEKAPSFFEIVFFVKKIRYRYGFEVNSKEVVNEWLYHLVNKKETYLFKRNKKRFEISRKFNEGRQLIKLTRENALFLSVNGQFNGEIASQIISWFNMLHVFSGRQELHYQSLLKRAFHGESSISNDIAKKMIVSIIKTLDLGIKDVQPGTKKLNSLDEVEVNTYLKRQLKQKDSLSILESIKEKAGEDLVLSQILTIHEKFDGKDAKDVYFNLEDHESDGTQKLFALVTAFVYTSILNTTLVVDEIDARLHQSAIANLIDLFHSKISNKNQAQLIFVTHAVGLLHNDRFRRDQIWFVEKDKFGASHLYSLSDFKVRNDASYQKDYLQGRYGAIPFIGAQNFMEGWTDAKETRKAS